MWNNNQKGARSCFQQISKQVFDPVRVPIHVGNEIVILTQQDVRTVIDDRYLIYEKISQDWLIKMYEDKSFDFTKLQQYGIDEQNNLQFLPSLPFLGTFQMTGEIPPQTAVVAPIQTQLDWEMTCPVNEFNLNNKKVTFSNDLEEYYNRKRKHINLDRNRKKLKTYTSRGCNTCHENVEYKMSDDCDNNDSDTGTVPTAQEQIKAVKKLKSSILWNNF